MPPAMPLLKLPCLCSSPPSLTLLPPLFLLKRRPRVMASVRAMLTATPVSPPATLSPSALTAALVPEIGSVSSKRRRLHLLRLQLMFLLSLQHLYPERFIYL
ncbi:hypothetical protein E1A91_D13G130500v1 [Gossypium mustelinum]|uniref:Uncharacterized protein n=1 Tax=Gossypium mustelinum TaxID=34275 RepID=A0A5D2S2H7_GOSMU|nr:hypothetical protein E1A91_D13G130500v1 [Gossypium mustelinum]